MIACETSSGVELGYFARTSLCRNGESCCSVASLSTWFNVSCVKHDNEEGQYLHLCRSHLERLCMVRLVPTLSPLG